MSIDAAKKILVSDFLNEDDYKELRHSIILKNETSNVSFLEAERITINEFKEDSICIKLPINICQIGHTLTILIFDSLAKRKFLKFPNLDTTAGLPIIGKVIELERKEDFVEIEIKFTQYKENLWKKLVQKYYNQQNKISSLISEVKK